MSLMLSRQVTVVLKGERTLIAFPDGRIWINPTGTPAMGTGGTGDILTGLISGLLRLEFPTHPDGGSCGRGLSSLGSPADCGAAAPAEKCLTATDLLRYLPAALEECAVVRTASWKKRPWPGRAPGTGTASRSDHYC